MNKKYTSVTATPCKSRVLGTQVERDGIIFSVAAASEETVNLILYEKETGEIMQELPFPEGAREGIVHTMKVSGIHPKKCEYNFRIGKRIIVDPAARAVVGRDQYGDFSDQGEHVVRSAFLTNSFEWGTQERLPHIPYEDVIAYQLHVRGFTKQKNSKVRHKGTFLGLQEKIPYLKELGINQVVLMPAYEFDEKRKEERIGMHLSDDPRYIGSYSGAADHDAGEKINYWGYIEGCYYAPKRSYSATNKPDVEFKNMVKTFHENGMEVIMEFYFPDTADLSMAADCLIWWMQEYHVDGFLLRMNQEGANVLAQNPFLMGCKLLSNYFPTDRIYVNGKKTADRNLAECNDGFKVTARKLLKGDEDQLSAFVSRLRYNPADSGVMNYITGHEGFTLMDLVSYDKKHNEENGEQGRDGAVYNYSWNCGVEGPTKKRSVTRLRMQQMKNAYAMLLLAQGTPMLLAGDEFGNSQGGNNNPYGIDSEVTWVDWSKEKSNGELTEFVRKLIRFRKEHRILHMAKELTGSDLRAYGYPDFSCHGSRAWYGAFEHMNRHVGVMYCGLYAGEETFIYVAYNLHWSPQKMALPYLPEGMGWETVFDTFEPYANAGSAKMNEQDVTVDSGEERKEKEFELPARCIRVLVGKKLPETKKNSSEKRSGRKMTNGN